MEYTISPYIKTTIMRRVKAIWFFRRVLPFLAVELALVAIVLQQIASSVFVNHVIQNAAVHTFERSPVMFADFFFRAFLNTETLIQTLVIASLIGSVFLLRDMARTFRTFMKQKGNLPQFSHVV